MSGLKRRIEQIEGRTGGEQRPYALLPVTCKTTEEWLETVRGTSQWVPAPGPVRGYVRDLIEVPDHG
jgi:hypothetical protein